jgi:hypothetical protein
LDPTTSEALMKPRLQVCTAGKRHFISVPDTYARALHDYLRAHRVQSSPPEPASTGFDSIELAAKTDCGAVQKLLDGWA